MVAFFFSFSHMEARAEQRASVFFLCSSIHSRWPHILISSHFVFNFLFIIKFSISEYILLHTQTQWQWSIMATHASYNVSTGNSLPISLSNSWWWEADVCFMLFSSFAHYLVSICMHLRYASYMVACYNFDSSHFVYLCRVQCICNYIFSISFHVPKRAHTAGIHRGIFSVQTCKEQCRIAAVQVFGEPKFGFETLQIRKIQKRQRLDTHDFCVQLCFVVFHTITTNSRGLGEIYANSFSDTSMRIYIFPTLSSITFISLTSAGGLSKTQSFLQKSMTFAAKFVFWILKFILCK